MLRWENASTTEGGGGVHQSHFDGCMRCRDGRFGFEEPWCVRQAGVGCRTLTTVFFIVVVSFIFCFFVIVAFDTRCTFLDDGKHNIPIILYGKNT